MGGVRRRPCLIPAFVDPLVSLDAACLGAFACLIALSQDAQIPSVQAQAQALGTTYGAKYQSCVTVRCIGPTTQVAVRTAGSCKAALLSP